MKNLFILITLIISNILFISCNDKVDEEFILSVEQKSLLPYTGGEIITFKLTSVEKTISYTASDPKIYFKENHDGYNQYYRFENMEQKLENEDGEILFNMAAGFSYSKTRFLFMWKNDFEGFPNVGNTIKLPVDTTEDKTIKILGDYTVNNTLYHDVFIADLNFPSSYTDTVFNGLVYPLNFYFSQGFGIVKMDMSDSTSFILEKVLR